MTAKEILDQLTNDEITPDEALDKLDGLSSDWSDALFEFGFGGEDMIQSYVDNYNDDFLRLKNFLDDLDPEQEWHYVDDNGWCDDTNFKATVIDFIKNHMEEE